MKREEGPMKHPIMAAGIFFILVGTAIADVGKEELKKLAQAGVSDDLILSYVRSKGTVEKLSADDLIELKRAGLSDALLARLVALPEKGIAQAGALQFDEVVRRKLL